MPRVDIGENMVSKKSKIVCSVKVSRLELVPLPIADQLRPNSYKIPCVEQRITKLDLEDYKTKVPCTVSLSVPKFLSSYFCV